MKFIADENFPKPSIVFLRNHDVDVKSIAEQQPGISDEQSEPFLNPIRRTAKSAVPR